MKITYNGIEELEKARELQKEATKLHLIPPIVSSFMVDKIVNDEVVERSINKSNSYIRNAYNLIASFVLHTMRSSLPTTYTDGGVAIVPYNAGSPSGSRYPTFYSNYFHVNNTPKDIYIGTGTTPDSMDDYKLENRIDDTMASGVLTSDYQFIGKTLRATISKDFINTEPPIIDVSETGLVVGYPGSSAGNTTLYMLLRDTFAPVPLLQYEGIKITYVLELLYP